MTGAVPALVKALEDPDYRVAANAATALGHAGLEPDIVVPALVKSMDYPQDQKRFNLMQVSVLTIDTFWGVLVRVAHVAQAAH